MKASLTEAAPQYLSAATSASSEAARTVHHQPRIEADLVKKTQELYSCNCAAAVQHVPVGGPILNIDLILNIA